MKLLTVTATLALTAALVASGSIAASAADTPSTTASSDECHFGSLLVGVWLHLPADLRSDLRDLKDQEPGDRAQAAREIRKAAKSGAYGPGVQDRANRMQDRRAQALATMPPELRADLRELREAAPAERRDLATSIADAARAGDYGPKAQLVAERLEESERWQNCVAN